MGHQKCSSMSDFLSPGLCASGAYLCIAANLIAMDTSAAQRALKAPPVTRHKR